MDIRSFFSASRTKVITPKDDFKPEKSKKKKTAVKEKKEESKPKKGRKRVAVILDSDSSEEDPFPKKAQKKLRNSDDLIIDDDDSDLESKNKVKNHVEKSKTSPKKKQKLDMKSPKKLKPISVSDFFDDSPVLHSSKKNPPKKEKKVELEKSVEIVHQDDLFEETLLQLDTEINDKTTTPKKIKSTENHVSPKILKQDIDSAKKTPEKSPLNNKHEKPASNQKSQKKTRKLSSEKPQLSDQERAEKKRQNYLNYLKFKEREGPRALGTKEIPESKPGCLSGLTFVITGILESIEREDAEELIKNCDGKVAPNVTKSVSYVIIGRDPGTTKLKKAEQYKLKQLSEDELFDLIRTASKNEEKIQDNAKNNTENLSLSGKLAGKLEKFKKSPKNETETPISPKKRKTNESDNKGVNDLKKLEKKSKFELQDDEVKSSKVTKSAQEFSPKQSLPGDKAFQMWVDKYKPASTKQLIGQQGDRSNAKKLSHWLQNWHKNRASGKKPNPAFRWGGGADDGSSYKAALLSGPPGIGKTTSAQLVCKESGFDCFELNASDTRSKRSLQEVISQVLSNKTIKDLQTSLQKGISSKHAIIMDEVDGMAGNEDRGGVQELIALIKASKVPIICICNDRNHQKMRSLVNYCFDLRFQRPRMEQIKAAMMSVIYKEGLKIDPAALQDVIIASNQDIRQILHNLSLWCANEKGLTSAQAKTDIGSGTKHIKLSPFDVLRKVFSANETQNMTIHDKSDLFFHDYSIAPLFVQENYLNVQPHAAKGDRFKHLQLISETANSICDGDIIEKQIRTGMNWSLLPVEAIFASVLPGEFMKGHLTEMINFPAWLGKNSTRNKSNRLIQELQMHMRLRISGNKTEVNLDYLPPIRDSISRPLSEKGNDGIREVIDVMEQYCLLREDVDSIMELSLWPGQKDPMSKVDSKVKAAFTRAYNKEGIRNPYAAINIKKLKKNSGSMGENELLEEEDSYAAGDNEQEEEEEDIGNDVMVKVKKHSTKRSTDEESVKNKGKGKASSRRGRPKKL